MSIKQLLLNCLFPKQCYGCQKNDTWLCRDCFLKIKTYQGQAPRYLKNVDDYFIAGEYKDPVLGALIRDFKFSFNQELKIPLSALLFNKIANLLCLNDNFLIIPIPLHRQRLAWRGFNQSELIAQEIANLNSWTVSCQLKKKVKNKEQAMLREHLRISNQEKVFCWQGQRLDGKSILLIDDIITSGATIAAAAAILRSAGAKKIIALAIAKG